jgi:hypothetical protein
MAKRQPNEIADEEMPDDEGLLETPAAPDDDPAPAPDDDDEGDQEPRPLEPDMPEEPAEDEGDVTPEPKPGEEGEELKELTDDEAGTDVADTDAEDDGKPFEELEGAVVYDGAGVFIPEGAPLDRLRQSLGLATQGSQEWTRERTQLTERVKELTETRGAEAMVAADVMELVFKDFATMDADQLYEWAVQFKEKEAGLRLEIREKLLERQEQQLEARKAYRAPADIERERTAGVAQIQTTIASTLEQLYTRPELANLTKEDKTKLLARANERAQQLAVQARDDSMIQFGIKKGELYLNAQQIYEWALDRAEVRDSEKTRRGVDIKNSRKLGKGKLSKAPGGGGAPRSTGGDEGGEWKPAATREEWLARMEAD